MGIVDKQASVVLTEMQVRVVGQVKVVGQDIVGLMAQTELTVLTERVVGQAGVDNKDKKVQKVSPVKTVLLAGVDTQVTAVKVVIVENRVLMVSMD